MHELGQLRHSAGAHVVEHGAVVVAIEGGGLFDGNGIRQVFGDMCAEAEGLDTIIRLAGGAGQGIDVFETKINFPRVTFAKGRATLSSDAIGYARQCGEVALVGSVHEGLCPELRFFSRLG